MSAERAAAVMTDGVRRESIRNILIIKWSAMGDVAIASAGLEDISRAFPDARIDLSTTPPWDQLFVDDPRLNKVMGLDVRGRHQLSAMWKWLREVARAGYDLVLDLQTTDRSRLLLSALWLFGTRIPHRAGNKPAFPYNLAPSWESRHAMKQLEATLGTAGIEAITPRPVLHYSESRRAKVGSMLDHHGLGKGFAVFLPGSQAAGYLKRWGAERFIRLAAELRAAGVEDIVILGGPDEVEECRRIAQAAAVVNLCGKTELLDVVAVCEYAGFVVGNDTGTAHVAAAAARPMVIICGPTDPLRVLPAGDNVDFLQADIPCINCYRKHCSHHTCMAWVTPDMVVEKLRGLNAL